ncbi:c670832a-30ea-4f7d-959c-d0bcb8ca4191 [Thermothielavioides terrestris]|uniref:C670832a-30ea-4f7d-959c-d0bcb8ca4191 n=1 Tax=Thermothielavioides terrestris TaxID=2587410 RepID=A0A446BV05_9PEZI|nr:c670832a-30ea-4f7d-959c-d0bcb8ca4191 [Thermothielavioides terrestris]
MTRKELLWSSSTDDLTQLDPTPAYEEFPPPALHILAATWGGVTVTPELRALARASPDPARLTLDLRSLHRVLAPDPAPGTLKVLTVLYRFGGGPDDGPADVGSGSGSGSGAGPPDGSAGLRLLCVPEGGGVGGGTVTLSRFATGEQMRAQLGQRRNVLGVHVRLEEEGPAWRAGPEGQVEILAVLYGPQRIKTPEVLAELAKFFEGKRGQIRTTNAFFRTDPWPYKRKTWSVYFRFVGSTRVQVVTGWEDGALEVPWNRD